MTSFARANLSSALAICRLAVERLAACSIALALAMLPIVPEEAHAHALEHDGESGSESTSATEFVGPSALGVDALSAFSLTVRYESPKCGTPTSFALDATGGSGQYMYQFSAVYQYGDDGWELITQPTKAAPYGKSNSFDFTFCASGRYWLKFYALDTGSSPWQTASANSYVTISDPEHPSCADIARSVASECLAVGNGTDFDKAVWVHDWILDHCTYDQSLYYCGPEGALARGMGTCESYHRAYVMILNRLGIPTGRIEGNGHVWTAVKMDGAWHQVDVTWDDIEYAYSSAYPDLRHMYFGLDDRIMGMVHSDHATATPGYESRSLRDNYFIKTKQISEWSSQFVSSIQGKLDAGSFSFSLDVGSSWPENFKNVIYNLVAYDLTHMSWRSNGSDLKVTADYGADAISVVAQESTAPTETIQMLRLYNPNSGEHFYTGDPNEKDLLVHLGWVFEGSAWKAPKHSDLPTYRLYNPIAGDHHYTLSTDERDMLRRVGWVYEGIGWYSDDARSVPIYRQYNPNAITGSHNFTSSLGEHRMLESSGWIGEGIAWYGCR